MVKLHKLHKLKEDTRLEKKRLHDKLYKEKKILFTIMDVLLVMCILFNFGAAVLTNLMVAKEKLDDIPQEIIDQEGFKVLELGESNPVQAELHGFETGEEIQNDYSIFVYAATIWFIVVCFYIYNRFTVHTPIGLYMMFAIVLIWATTTGYDFFNNFGFWLAMQLFG